MSLFRLTDQMRAMIIKAKASQSGTAACDPRAMYPVGHACGATTSPVTKPPTYIKLARPIFDAGGVPVPPDAKIVKSEPLIDGGAVATIQTKNGDTVEATTDANGAVKSVSLKDNKMLLAAAAVAAFFIFGG